MFYTLTRHGYENIKTKISKLNKIAKKLEQPEIIFDLIKTEFETEPKTHTSQKMYYIMCIGEAPQLKDWKFMCTLDFTPKGNLYNTTYNYDAEDVIKIPDRFRTTSFELCEDCGVKRYRTSVFVLYNQKEDKWMQVGSSCLGSFLGVNETDVHQLAEFATTLASMPKAMDKWIGKAKEAKKNQLYSGYKVDDLLTSLFMTVRLYKERGGFFYAPQAANRSYHDFYLRINTFWKDDKVIAEDIENAKNLLTYWRSEKHSTSRFLKVKNTYVALQNDILARKHYKFVSYAFRSYISEHRFTLYPVKKIEPVAEFVISDVVPVIATPVAKVVPVVVPTSNSFVGEVGKEIKKPINAKVKFAKAMTGKYGKFCMTVANDVDGNELVFASNKTYYNIGDLIRIKSATVKKHSMYKDVKQTVLGQLKF